MKTFDNIVGDLMESVNTPLSESSNSSAASTIKQIDGFGDKLDSLESQFIKSVAGKGGANLKRLGLDDSSSKSSKQVEMHYKKITDAFESLTVALSDLANDIDDYHQ